MTGSATTTARTSPARREVRSTVSGAASGPDRAWVHDAVRVIEADAARSADTHLQPVPLPRDFGVHLYVKDESTHPTGSLKHRLARSLFLYALCNGEIGPTTTVVEASSGSTAISEAYFARLLGLEFRTVVPARTSPVKTGLIEQLGGICHLVEDPASIYAEAQRLADVTGGHYMDQFTYAERATDWRGNNNIAESIFAQMALEQHPVPAWVVIGAGTGGTAATIGRYLRYRRLDTRLCVVDPDGSSFFDSWAAGDPTYCSGTASHIEGIGRPRVEPSFVPGVVDRMLHVPDDASLAGMHYLAALLGRRVGASTGTNFVGALTLADEMRATGQTGSIVALICDGGDRYSQTYYDDRWLAENDVDLGPWTAHLSRLMGDCRPGGDTP